MIVSMPKTSKRRFEFTVDFHFFKGKAFCDGFTFESDISKAIAAMYRIVVQKKHGGAFETIPSMEEPMTQDEVHAAIEKMGGSVEGTAFIFEVFTGNQRVYTTQFNADENFPLDGYEADRISVSSFSWSFDLPAIMRLQ